jgi:chemotaxis protein MotB
MGRSVIAVPLLAFVLIGSGCVSKATYDAAIQSADKARATLEEQVAACQSSRGAACQASIADLQQRLAQTKSEFAEETTKSKTDIERLRREEAAIEARAALFRDLARRLAKMVDAGDLRIALRDGRMVLQLPNDILFDTGKTDVKPAGRATLEKLASVLKTVQGHHFQVAGHTDNVPIETLQFPSNWELSAARALVVVHFLVGHGMDPSVLSAAGFGEFDPVAANDKPADRARNRRTEITVQPNIDELVSVPEAL